MIQTPWFAYLLSGSIILTLILFVILAIKNQNSRSIRFFFFLILEILIWQVGYLIELLYISDAVLLLIARLEYFGIAFVPVTWFSFVFFFLEKKMPSWAIGIYFIIPILTMIFALTPSLNHLMWTKREILNYNGYHFLKSEYGVWFWIQTVYAYILMILPVVSLVLAFFKTFGTQKIRIAFLLIGALFPWIANILTLFGNGWFAHLDFTALSFVITIILVSINSYVFSFLQLQKLAQKVVYQRTKDIIFIIDNKDVIIEINPFARHFFETLGIKEVRGQKMESFFKFIGIEVEIGNYNDVVFSLQKEQGNFLFEMTVTRLIQNKNTGTIVVLHNISERVQAEKQLLVEIQKNKEQQTIMIQQDRLASMGQMLGAIAHQWRQPLNSLGIIIQDFKDAYEYGELDQTYLEDSVKRAMAQIEFLSGTIDDFRNFFRRDKKRETFQLYDIVYSLLNILNIQLLKHNIQVRLEFRETTDSKLQQTDSSLECVEEFADCADCSFEIESIPNEIKQVLLNLINNAKDAIIERREKENIEFQGQILIKLFKEETHYIIQVEDNGGGIPLNVLDKIFNPYFSTKEEGKGTGIGLYMSKMIVENSLGGQITAQTNIKGATFTLILPKN